MQATTTFVILDPTGAGIRSAFHPILDSMPPVIRLVRCLAMGSRRMLCRSRFRSEE